MDPTACRSTMSAATSITSSGTDRSMCTAASCHSTPLKRHKLPFISSSHSWPSSCPSFCWPNVAASIRLPVSLLATTWTSTTISRLTTLFLSSHFPCSLRQFLKTHKQSVQTTVVWANSIPFPFLIQLVIARCTCTPLLLFSLFLRDSMLLFFSCVTLSFLVEHPFVSCCIPFLSL